MVNSNVYIDFCKETSQSTILKHNYMTFSGHYQSNQSIIISKVETATPIAPKQTPQCGSNFNSQSRTTQLWPKQMPFLPRNSINYYTQGIQCLGIWVKASLARLKPRPRANAADKIQQKSLLLSTKNGAQ